MGAAEYVQGADGGSADRGGARAGHPSAHPSPRSRRRARSGERVCADASGVPSKLPSGIWRRTPPNPTRPGTSSEWLSASPATRSRPRGTPSDQRYQWFGKRPQSVTSGAHLFVLASTGGEAPWSGFTRPSLPARTAFLTHQTLSGGRAPSGSGLSRPCLLPWRSAFRGSRDRKADSQSASTTKSPFDGCTPPWRRAVPLPVHARSSSGSISSIARTSGRTSSTPSSSSDATPAGRPWLRRRWNSASGPPTNSPLARGTPAGGPDRTFDTWS